RPRRLDNREDAIERERPDREVVVAGPAEATEIRAAPDHLDEQPRSKLRVRREDARERRIQVVGRAHGGLAHDRRRRGTRAWLDGRNPPGAVVDRLVQRRYVAAALQAERLEQCL